jgi:hypothetical protein
VIAEEEGNIAGNSEEIGTFQTDEREKKMILGKSLNIER